MVRVQIEVWHKSIQTDADVMVQVMRKNIETDGYDGVQDQVIDKVKQWLIQWKAKGNYDLTTFLVYEMKGDEKFGSSWIINGKEIQPETECDDNHTDCKCKGHN